MGLNLSKEMFNHTTSSSGSQCCSLIFLKKSLVGLQSNGLDERINQMLQSMLSKTTIGLKELWDKFTHSAIFAYNTSSHASTKYTPFEVMFGRNAVLPIDIDLHLKSTTKLRFDNLCIIGLYYIPPTTARELVEGLN